MKKMIVLLVSILLVVATGVSCAEGIDYAVMSDEDLHAVVNSARNELTRRELIAAEKLVLLDRDGVQAYLTGEYRIYGSDEIFMEIEAVVINDSEASVSLMSDGCCINGWDVWCMGIGDTTAGKKKKGNITVKLTDAEISTYEEIEEIEFSLYLSNSETYQRINESETLVVHFNAE